MGPTGALGPQGDKGIQGDKGEKVMHLLFLVHPLWVEGFILFMSTKEALRQTEFLPKSCYQGALVLKTKGGLVPCRSQKLLERMSARDAFTKAQLRKLPWLKMSRICSVLSCSFRCGDLCPELGSCSSKMLLCPSASCLAPNTVIGRMGSRLTLEGTAKWC